MSATTGTTQIYDGPCVQIFAGTVAETFIFISANKIFSSIQTQRRHVSDGSKRIRGCTVFFGVSLK